MWYLSSPMDNLPSAPDFDSEFYSAQMDRVLSDTARTCKTVIKPPKKKFERDRFVNAMNEAFELIGGIPRLAIWADSNPTEFYRLYSKTIPQASLLDIQGRMSMQILPAIPRSGLDDPIDVTPEKKDGD